MLLLLPASAMAEEPASAPPAATDLASLSIEQLMDIEVTSVAKKAQKLSEAAAAIYVITHDDIRRSGMTTVPELLRTVPGLDVAQVSNDTWAVGARGLNNRFSNKLLVLIDGRSVYSLTHGGVNWDVQNVLLEDIDRIEVIRGPGGALWGANAVNGVINIITKSAKDTQGGLVSAAVGNIEQPNVAFRYGGELGASSYLRVYGQSFRRDNFQDPTGGAAHDGWDGNQVGFRFDSTPSNDDTLMLQGEFYAQDADSRLRLTSLTPPFNAWADNTDRNTGGHALARWEHRLAAGSSMALQAYYDRADRSRTAGEDQRVETFDVDFQHSFALTPNQNAIWGLGYRSVDSEFADMSTVSFVPPRRRIEIYSGFIQDEIALRENLHLTLGSKFEHNSFTGFEYQPNVRLIWEARPGQTLWAAVSRAVRMPDRFDRDVGVNAAVIPGPLPTVIAIEGNPDYQSEDVLAFEAGYRGQVAHRVTMDVAGFYNRYDKLQTLDPAVPFVEFAPPPPHLVIPLQFNNLMHGETYGVEIAAKWQVTDTWRLSSSYSRLEVNMRLDPPSTATDSLGLTEGSDPRNQFQLRSQLDLPHHLELDAAVYYVDSLRALNIPSYTRVDLRLGWRPRPNLELSLVGQNLLDGRHQEFGGEMDALSSQTPRSFYGRAVWSF